MRPYIGIESRTSEPEDPLDVAVAVDPTTQHGKDLRNIVIVIVAWATILVLIPPQHEYPIIDDWVYAKAVRSIIETGHYIGPQEAQANLVGLAYWGSLWSWALGFNFSTLTYSTLSLAALSLIAFYAIARQANIPPPGALLGTLMLMFNPLFLHLSYSFMTDVPFLGIMLASCFCYMRGLRRVDWPWLLVGGLLASASFLVRQFGIMIPMAFIGYLVLEGLSMRRRRWREIFLAGVMPIVVFTGWYIWSRGMPPTAAEQTGAARTAAFFMKEAWLHVTALRTFTLLPLIAFFTCGAFVLQRTRWWLIALAAATILWGTYAADWPMDQWNPMSETPFTFTLGPLAVPLPQEEFSFGRVGNIIRVDGIDFFQYTQAPIWSPEAWRALWVVAAILAVPLCAKLAEGLLEWIRALIYRRTLAPIAGFYLLGLLILVTTIALGGDFYDRYTLPVLPALIIFLVRGSPGWGRRIWTCSASALAIIAVFSTLLKADQVDHDNTRMEAATWMLERSAVPQVGYDWNNWFAQGDPMYHISDLPQEGFRVEHRFPYVSRLDGFQVRYVLAEAQTGAPPLQAPAIQTLP